MILDIFSQLTDALLSIYPEEEVHSISYLLVEELTGIERHKIRFHLDEEITENQETWFLEALERLKKHEPIQYVLGKANFFDMQLAVTPDVLIPRPETEELVALVNQAIRKDLQSKSHLRVLDIGTGSGCIPIAIKKTFPQVEVVAIEVSGPALQVAKANARKLSLNIDFIELDILKVHANELPYFDILVSNPPYVLEKDQQHIAPNVLEYEPALALFPLVEDDLIFYRTILSLFNKIKQKGKRLFFEIHEERGEALLKLANKLEWAESNILNDLQGKDRFFAGLV